MPGSTEHDLSEQLKIIRRELRLLRWLLVFVSFCGAIFLFDPSLALRIAVWSAPIMGFAAPALGCLALIVVLLVIAATVVRRYSPPSSVTTESLVETPSVLPDQAGK